MYIRLRHYFTRYLANLFNMKITVIYFCSEFYLLQQKLLLEGTSMKESKPELQTQIRLCLYRL